MIFTSSNLSNGLLEKVKNVVVDGYKKSFGYKKNGYQGIHSLSVSVAYYILHIETCVESSGSPLKTNVSLEG